MRRITAILFMAALLASCQISEQEQAPPPPPGGVQPKYGWLDHANRVNTIQRYTAPDKTDIRQACYVGSGAARYIALVQRDYSTSNPDVPDPISALAISLANGERSEVALDGRLVEMAAGPSHDKSALLLLADTGIGTFTDEPMSLALWQPGQDPEVFKLDGQMLPLYFSGADSLVCQKVKAVQLENGLLSLSPDWSAASQVVSLTAEGAHGADGMPSPDGGKSFTYKVGFDSNNPAAAAVTYTVPGLGAGQGSWSFPYHITYSAFPWRPLAKWATASEFVVLAFEPFAGTTKANYQGLFRLVGINTESGHASIIEDHLSSDLPFQAGDGLLYYSRKTAAGDTVRWEVWASSPDGMQKRLLWNRDDALYVSVEDYFDGSLLLVVQSLLVQGNEPRLVYELHEVSLNELKPVATPGFIPDGAAPPLRLPDSSSAPTQRRNLGLPNPGGR